MRFRLLSVLLLIAVILAACAPAEEDTRSRLVSILEAWGFDSETTDLCSDCVVYTNTAHQVSVQVFGDGAAYYFFPMNDDEQVGKYVSNIVGEVYGPKVLTWVTEHLLPTRDSGDQAAIVDGFDIYMTVEPGNNGLPPYMIMDITPVQ